MIPALALLIAFSARAVLIGPPPPHHDDVLPDGAVATVDGEELGEDQFFGFVGQIVSAEADKRDLIELLIQERVVGAEAERRGLHVTEEQLSARYRSLDAETLKKEREGQDQ